MLKSLQGILKISSITYCTIVPGLQTEIGAHYRQQTGSGDSGQDPSIQVLWMQALATAGRTLRLKVITTVSYICVRGDDRELRNV